MRVVLYRHFHAQRVIMHIISELDPYYTLIRTYDPFCEFATFYLNNMSVSYLIARVLVINSAAPISGVIHSSIMLPPQAVWIRPIGGALESSESPN